MKKKKHKKAEIPIGQPWMRRKEKVKIAQKKREEDLFASTFDRWWFY